MVATPNIRVSQSDVVGVNESGQDIQVSQADILSVYNFPTEFLQASGADVSYVSKTLENIQVSHADVVAVVRGRVDDPSIRAWTFTLDGHDFYVLRLGNEETLVYDLTSQQWSVWGSDVFNYWWTYTGANWFGGNTFASVYGSNVIVGSDSNGSLYFLDPLKSKDDSPVDGRDEFSFTRQVTGQLPVRGYNNVRVYEVQLLGSVSQLGTDFDTDIELLYSDDRGDSYVSAGVITTSPQDYDIRASWRSLGSMNSPGRLFRIQDTGALQRVDTITANTSLKPNGA